MSTSSAAPAPPDAPPAKRPAGARFAATIGWIKEHYCTMDPRTAGVFRWVLGFLCAAHLLRHWQEAQIYYSNDGVLTNHYHLFRPASGYHFSLYHAFSSLGEVHIAFALSLFCHLALMVGWHARLFSIINFILVTSLDSRLVMVENGGYIVVNLLAFYAMFLPVGQRFSLDALLRSYRERKEKTVLDLNERYRPAWVTDPFVSMAALVVILNLAVVYFFNVVNKSGQIWRSGDTVHYVLHLNRMVTGLAVFFRDILPYPVTRGISWIVLCVEAMLVTMILAPYARRLTRPIAMLGMWGLHGSFGIMMRLGPFSWFMIGWSSLLLAPEQWDALERWYRKRAAPRVVVYDRSSPLAFALARLLTRLDRLELLRFEESEEGVSDVALMAARDPESGRVFTDFEALREIVRALPGGRYALPVLQVLSFGLLGAMWRAMGARREAIARFFGLTLPPRGAAVVERPSALGRFWRRQAVRLREIVVVYYALCAIVQAINENKAIPAAAKIRLPKAMETALNATLIYPRLFQGWGMFAPNPITDDGSVTVVAWTRGGRRVDPFTGEEPDLDLTDARGLGLTQIEQDYWNRIRIDRNKVYRQGLREYLLRWHELTGHPEDEIVAFDVYWVRAQCPLPHQDKAYDNETIAILTYRKPGYKPPPGAPPIPPSPRLESADSPTTPNALLKPPIKP